MQKIIYETETGISIIHPVKSVVESLKDIPAGVEYKIVEEADIPTDRTFRGAWNMDLKEDVTKAKTIWKDKLRTDRVSKFNENDLTLRDAVLEDDEEKKTAGLAERTRLRDITGIVDNCSTIAEIKEVAV